MGCQHKAFFCMSLEDLSHLKRALELKPQDLIVFSSHLIPRVQSYC